MLRTMRIEGDVEMVSEEQSTEYYHTRPVGSQLGAWASNQSSVIKDRDELDKKMEVKRFRNT